MKYRIISVGKIKESYYLEGVKEYLKRLGPYISIELADGLEEKVSPKLSEKEIEVILKKEAEKIKKLISADEIIILLDVQGKQIASEELAQNIETWNASGKKRVNFIVGGANGLAKELKKEADGKISISKMTFPHQMAVLILVEQIYRGFRIIKGEPYHK